MARSPKTRSLVPASSNGGLTTQTMALIESLDTNPSVANYRIEVDKDSNVAKVRMVSRDGQTVTRDYLGPGLTSTMVSVSVGSTPTERRESRHDNICALYRSGLTQTEIAERLDCSQSLVSSVLRQNRLR